ncbi:energy transducer TonB, partial [Lichenihabitans sp. Uapishka_5]|uniref:energy transducer TonB family protein n=1 Tax=Lichenihabitans sp. Uapishka_5 TaxID=3037302 RepID=UPI0029E7E945
RKALADKREHARQAQQAARSAARAAARADEARQGSGQGSAPAAPSSAASGAETATWRGAVVAHLNSFKPASNGASGTARVAFAVDGGGRVVSASLAGSSGDAGLDAAAVAMVRRASPVPAPPPGLGGRINLTIPVRFH